MAALPSLALGERACCGPVALAHCDTAVQSRRRRLAVARHAAAAAATAGRGRNPAAEPQQQQQREPQPQAPTHSQHPSSAVSRRAALLGSLQAAAASGALAAFPQAAWAAVEPGGIPSADVTVGKGMDCATIGEALQRVPPGGTIEVYGGRYLERLVITRPVSITAAPGAAVEVAWQTGAPYEAAVEVLGVRQPDAVLLRGLRIRHSSKSVANNYAVRLEGCDATLLDCDISSASGDGVGIEGGAPRLLRCAVHDCQRHGVAVFGDLLGQGCAAALDKCSLTGNRLSGLLVRDGATPTVTRCLLADNGEWGLQLLDAGGAYTGNDIAANSKGSVAYSLLYDEVDTARMVLQNKLDRRVTPLGKV